MILCTSLNLSMSSNQSLYFYQSIYLQKSRSLGNLTYTTQIAQSRTMMHQSQFSREDHGPQQYLQHTQQPNNHTPSHNSSPQPSHQQSQSLGQQEVNGQQRIGVIESWRGQSALTMNGRSDSLSGKDSEDSPIKIRSDYEPSSSWIITQKSQSQQHSSFVIPNRIQNNNHQESFTINSVFADESDSALSKGPKQSVEPSSRDIKNAIAMLIRQYPESIQEIMMQLYCDKRQGRLFRWELYGSIYYGCSLKRSSEPRDLSDQSSLEEESQKQPQISVQEDSSDTPERQISSSISKQQIKIMEPQKKQQIQANESILQQQIQLDIGDLIDIHLLDPKQNNNQSSLQKYLEDNYNQVSEESYFRVPVTKGRFNSLEEKQRFVEKRVAAKAFVRKGYGLTYVRKQIAQTRYPIRFDQSRYKTISHGMIIDAFRKLEQTIAKVHASKMQRMDVRHLSTFLLNCRDFLSDVSPSFIKIIKAVFSIDCKDYIQIDRQMTINFYNRVMEYYIGKQDGRIQFNRMTRNIPKNHRIYQSQSIGWDNIEWTFKDQCQMMRYYMEIRNISGVRDKYRENLGMGTIYDDCKFIKSKVNKSLRAAIRKLKSIVGENQELAIELSYLNGLNNDRIKRVLISPEAVETRVALCQFYMDGDVRVGRVRQLVGQIERALSKIGGRRMQMDYMDVDA